MGHREYFISDTHFSHESIVKFERTQFSNVEEHDEFILQMYRNLADRVKEGDIVYHLGDWGNTDYLWVNRLLTAKKAKTVFVMGNHDKQSNLELYNEYFDEVHEHAYFLTDRILLSHRPYMLAEPGVLNVCGHLHASTLNSPNHVICSVDVIDYVPVERTTVDRMVGKLPKYKTRFLEESYAHLYKFSEKRNNTDVIVDSDGNINLPATMAYRKIMENNRD